MDVTISIWMDTLNDGDFDTRNDYYKDNDEFFDAMRAEIDRNANVAYDVVSNLGNVAKGRTATFSSADRSVENTNASIYKCSATLFDENGNDETVDGLISKVLSDDVVVSVLKYDFDDMDEEFEEDLRLWISDHVSIGKYADKIGEDKVWENEPKRDFILTFKNKSDEDVSVEYVNCRIVGDLGEMKYAILAEKAFIVDKKF